MATTAVLLVCAAASIVLALLLSRSSARRGLRAKCALWLGGAILSSAIIFTIGHLFVTGPLPSASVAETTRIALLRSLFQLAVSAPFAPVYYLLLVSWACAVNRQPSLERSWKGVISGAFVLALPATAITVSILAPDRVSPHFPIDIAFLTGLSLGSAWLGLLVPRGVMRSLRPGSLLS